MKHKTCIFLIMVVVFGFLMVNDTFGVAYYNLNITINGSGTVNKNPDEPDYEPGQSVTLTAVPDKGWKFIRWEGDLTGSDNPESISMTSDKNITAVFEKLPNTASKNLLLLDE